MRRVRGAALALAVALVPLGCGGGGGTSTPVRLVIPDNNIRVEGDECAGARPFHDLHAGTPYAVETPAGEVVASGELPAGRAENADPAVDWQVERIPTVCVLTLAPRLPGPGRYRLRAGRWSVELVVAAAGPREPVTVVVG